MCIIKIIFLYVFVIQTIEATSNFYFIENLIKDLSERAKREAVTKVNEDAGLDIYQYLRKYDYPIETHWVQTEDGYVLRMHRLLGGKNGTFYEAANKPAVLLMHGLLSSSVDFVNTGPNRSIGLVLADAGYDVWLGNNRGNTWSRDHVTLDPDTDTKFWDYSFETCGYYDLPAKIDYIIAKTGQQKIFYVGHSQGTTQFFAMAALRPEYNEKIALMSALAPVVYMSHMSSPLLRLMVKYFDILEILLVNILNVHELMGHSTILQQFGKYLFQDPVITEIAATFMFTLCGFNDKQFDRSILPVVISNAPAGISVNMILHYGQEIKSGKFRRFDYGILNLKHYKSASPPDFNISAITAPIALYYSQNDFFAAVQDVEKLAGELPNLVKKRMIEDKRFNHIDYIWAKDVNSIINQDLIAFQNKFIPSQPPNNEANCISSSNPFYALILLIFSVIICT